jgi:hypothetical protein
VGDAERGEDLVGHLELVGIGEGFDGRACEGLADAGKAEFGTGLRCCPSQGSICSYGYTFQAPVLIERAGPSTRKKFFEFFTVPIRNANTRAAYYRAIQQFLFWCERAGYQDLEDIEPITVAAYIETLQRQAAPILGAAELPKVLRS